MAVSQGELLGHGILEIVVNETNVRRVRAQVLQEVFTLERVFVVWIVDRNGPACDPCSPLTKLPQGLDVLVIKTVPTAENTLAFSTSIKGKSESRSEVVPVSTISSGAVARNIPVVPRDIVRIPPSMLPLAASRPECRRSSAEPALSRRSLHARRSYTDV